EGQMWLERTLPAGEDCDALENAAAVVLLAWETQLPAPVQQVAESLPLEDGWSLRVGASGQLWLSSALATWGAAGEVAIARQRFPLGLSLEVLGQGRREVALGGGHAAWSRLSFAGGPTVRLSVYEGLDGA